MPIPFWLLPFARVIFLAFLWSHHAQADTRGLLAAPLDCPAGFVKRGIAWPAAGHCESPDGKVLGPFSSAMVRACYDSRRPASECEGLTWNKALYLTLRGASVCDRGTVFDETAQRCRETRTPQGIDNVFGPFSAPLIRACLAAQGGVDVCNANRWGTGFFQSLARSAPVRTPLSEANEIRGIYISHFELEKLGEPGLRALARRLLARNVNTVYLSVYVHGYALWPSKAYAEAGGLSAPGNPARMWGRIFREEGLHPVAWFENGLLIGPSDHPIAVRHPDWLQRDAQGRALDGEMQSVFLSPGSTGARTLVVEMLRELAAPDMPFEEIQLDHFHWTVQSNGREPGYEQATAFAWRKDTGREPPLDANDPQWVAFRENLLQSLVRDAYLTVKAERPTMRLTACPEAMYALEVHMKNWPKWLDAGIIDGITVQNYYADDALFLSQLRSLAKLARDRGQLSRFGVALDGSMRGSSARVERQLRMARDEGIYNATLWAWHDYGDGYAVEETLERHTRSGNVWSAPALQPYR